MPYRPDDAQLTLDALDYLRTPAGMKLRSEIAALPDPANPTVAQIVALRKSFPNAATHAALVLARLQPKATGTHGKFPNLPYLWAAPEALEQATHTDVGLHKAARMMDLGATHVFDLCAGIGGDTLAFATRMPVTAVELSPVRAKCLEFNLLESPPPHPVEVRIADVATLLPQLPAGAWVHIDPARRSAGRRSPRFDDLIPGPELLAKLLGPAASIRAAIKLSPAVDFDDLPEGHLELISHRGSVVQALLWTGTALPATQRTATVLSDHGRFQLIAVPRLVSVSPAPVETFSNRPTLYELDGALTRAGLAQHMAESLGLQALTYDGGYLLSTGDQRPTLPTDMAAALTPFDIHKIVPFSSVISALEILPQSHSGPVEVKCRGHVPGIDTDDLQRRWTAARGLRGACTALLFRQDHQTLAAIGFRI